MNNIQFMNLDENDKNILKLEVNESQKSFIETVPECMQEVKEKSYNINWQPNAILNNDCLIGFAMYGKSVSGNVWLDRFMIDKHFQGKGLGKVALPLLIKKILNEFNTNKLFLSVNKNNEIAIKLYEENGFNFIDELDGKDPIMEYQKAEI